MHTLHTRNVNQALPLAMDLIKKVGKSRKSRYGDVLVSPVPITTLYEKPTERVIFWPERDANPFFHFMESLWMLAGRNDVEFVKKYAKRMETFSDDGKTFHAAYGYRWRKQFGADQLSVIARRLKDNPDDRRQVLQIWDAELDLYNQNTKDIPCNLTVNFQVNVDGKLDMYVFNRSNDIIWGCYGANAVHFSMLQEYMAGCIEVPVGRYWQISTNWHGYVETVTPLLPLGNLVPEPYTPSKLSMIDPYANKSVEPFNIFNTDEKTWNEDLLMFLDESIEFGYRDVFFRRVALPIKYAYAAYKNGDKAQAMEILEQCHATDWKKACQEWIQRRVK